MYQSLKHSQFSESTKIRIKQPVNLFYITKITKLFFSLFVLRITDNFSLSLLDSNDEVQPLEAHWILQPRTSQKFKVSFQASKSGQYENEFFFTLLDNPAATFRISVEGVADIPRLDATPIAIFNAVC